WQADMHPFTPLQREAASHIIDAIDDNGLLAGWDDVRDDLTQDPGLTPDAVESVLAAIQAFDPPGIGARGLAECLAIQLHQIDAETEGLVLALNLVENGHLDALARGPADVLARRLGATPDELKQARALLQTLQPYPGD